MAYADTTDRRDYGSGATIPSDLEKLEDLGDWEIAEGETDPRGYDLMGGDGQTIGTIENLLASPSTQKAHFAIVETGGWFDNRRFAVPLYAIEFKGGRAYTPFVREQFQSAPEWHHGDGDWNRYDSYWMGLAAVPAASSAAPAASDTVRAGEEVVIPVVEEELQVGKRQVERGGVRIASRVLEQPVEQAVQLREEHVTVERHPVDRPVTDADRAAFQEGAIEVTERAEEPVVAKQARVVEEVVVSKDVEQRTETVQGTVRRTDVDIEEEEADLRTPRQESAPRV
jgi:uncharacterized protein (TIGR02271 family)